MRYIWAILAFCLLLYPAFAGQTNMERLSKIADQPFEKWIKDFNYKFATPIQRNFDNIEQKLNDLVSLSPTVSVTATDGLTVTNPVMKVQGSGGAVTVTANPSIKPGYDGQQIVIIGKSDTNTLTFSDGNGLALTASFTLGATDTLSLVYDSQSATWNERARANN